MAGTFSSVPIVDFARLNDPVTKDEELSNLREAIFVVGFLYLTNTGLEVRITNHVGDRDADPQLR
jgi:Isopenicillin N synthase and related dioxygenases